MEDLKMSYLSDRPGNDDVINAIYAASTEGSTTYVLDTISGNRIAAIVPVDVAEAAGRSLDETFQGNQEILGSQEPAPAALRLIDEFDAYLSDPEGPKNRDRARDMALRVRSGEAGTGKNEPPERPRT